MTSKISVEKINESYVCIVSENKAILDKIFLFLKLSKPNARFNPMIMRGLESPFIYYSKFLDNKHLCVYYGLLPLLTKFGVPQIQQKSQYSEDEINKYLSDIENTLPFKPYDYQTQTVKECLRDSRKIAILATSAGKSLIIALICDFLRLHNKHILLLVPNINLLTQFKSDIESYNLVKLYNNIELLGSGNVATFEKTMLISTWQSMTKHKDKLKNYQCIICDELHRYAGEVVSDIIKKASTIDMRFGFTGTLPEDLTMKMTLISLFSMPKKFVTPAKLIEMGLATPIKINSIIFRYPTDIMTMFNSLDNYSQQLKVIKEYTPRTNFIVRLAVKLRKDKQNTLVLFQHTNHGKDIFISLMKHLYNIEVENKDIVGKKSFEFQEKYRIYFMNGEDDAVTREKTRKILEHNDDAILIANYAVCSTGINMKKLHNLIFASPLKAFTTVAQSLGRLMRKHNSKTEANELEIPTLDIFPPIFSIMFIK